LRANSNFSVINKLVIFDSVINLILMFLLVKTYKLYGFYVAVILLAAFNCLFMHFFARYKISLKFDLKKDIYIDKVWTSIVNVRIFRNNICKY